MKIEFSADDLKLLSYDTYEHYLDSLIRPEDYRFLRCKSHCRLIAELGYTSNSSLSRIQFERKQAAAHEHLHPMHKPHILASIGCTPNDPLIYELMQRERANRVNLLLTIIYVRIRTKAGIELSGYIDYASSLQRYALKEENQIDWHRVFNEKQRISVRPADLGYYNWHTGLSITNDTRHFKVVTKPRKGLIFVCRIDRRTIAVDPLLHSPGISTTRIEFKSPKYEHAVLFDHVPRSKY